MQRLGGGHRLLADRVLVAEALVAGLAEELITWRAASRIAVTAYARYSGSSSTRPGWAVSIRPW